MRALTRKELRQYRGQDDAPICFACRGKVHDASGGRHWRGGVHWLVHGAGEDLTDALSGAPHGAELRQRLAVVGVLVD